MDSTKSPNHYLQFHQQANSPYLYKLAQDEWLTIERNTFLRIVLGKQIDTININKSNYTCYEDNSNGFMHCMEKYYSEKLGCILPWALRDSLKADIMNLCKGKEKFKEFRNITMNILKPEENKKLINNGCFIPNCMQRYWEIRKEWKQEFWTKTGFKYDLPQHTKVLLREEVELYTLINFFAEVGGYLGLLLGESLVSYIITASKWFQILRRKLEERCRKNN